MKPVAGDLFCLTKGRSHMVKRALLVGATLLLVSLTVNGCGISKEDNEAVIAEKDSAQAEIQSIRDELEAKYKSLESDYQSLRLDFDILRGKFTQLQNSYSKLEAENGNLQSLPGQHEKVAFYDLPIVTLSGFESVVDWSLTRAQIDGADAAVGDKSLVFMPEGKDRDAFAEVDFTNHRDFRLYNLSYRAKVDDWAKVSSVKWIFRHNSSDAYSGEYMRGMEREMLSNRWYKVTISIPSADWGQISSMEIRITGAPGASIHIDDVQLVPKYAEPFFTFVFDDGLVSQYTIAPPILDRHGYKGTIALSLAHTAKPSYLDTVYYKYGWDLASHTVTHPRLWELSGEEQWYELVASQRWLLEHGYERGSNFFVAPFGLGPGSNAVIDKVFSVYDGYRLEFGPQTAHNDYPNTHVSFRAGIEGVRAAIDRAYENNDWLIIYGHEVGEEAEVTPDDLDAVARYLHELGATVKNPSEVYP